MRIVNPTFGRRSEPAQVAIPLLDTDWSKDAIALISNSKPNARELLEGLMGRMAARGATGPAHYLAKTAAAIPAPPALLDEVAARCRGAILALSD